MAAACYRVSDKAHGTSSNADEDERLLKDSAVEAVMFIGDYSAEIMLQAARKVKSESSKFTAESLQQAVDEVIARETQASCMNSHVAKTKHHHHEDLGSDGEPEERNRDTAMEVDHDDLETDDAEADAGLSAVPHFGGEVPRVPPRELEADVQCTRKNISAADVKKKLKVLKSENRRLKERSMCKQCHSKPLSITFLPCGHYSYCYECGQAFSACPICKRTILADVRTFLA